MIDACFDRLLWTPSKLTRTQDDSAEVDFEETTDPWTVGPSVQFKTEFREAGFRLIRFSTPRKTGQEPLSDKRTNGF